MNYNLALGVLPNRLSHDIMLALRYPDASTPLEVVPDVVIPQAEYCWYMIQAEIDLVLRAKSIEDKSTVRETLDRRERRLLKKNNPELFTPQTRLQASEPVGSGPGQGSLE